MTTMAARISSGCWPCDSCAARAVPWKLPRTLLGMAISASAARTAAWPSAKVLSSARLYEMVVASSASWWLMEAAVGRSAKRASADSGTITCVALASGWPLAWSRRPGLMVALVVVDDVLVEAVAVLVALAVVAPATVAAAAVFLAGTYTS